MEFREKYIDVHTHHPLPDVISPSMEGIHPWQATANFSLPNFDVCDLIGETGLDFASDVDRVAQETLFKAHLSEAERLKKGVVLHVVKAFEPAMNILAKYNLCGVVFHGFVGSMEQAKRCFKRGYHLSFGHRSLASPRTVEVIKVTPEEFLFCETDDTPSPSIEEIYGRVAELRNTSVEELRRSIAQNYNRLIFKG